MEDTRYELAFCFSQTRISALYQGCILWNCCWPQNLLEIPQTTQADARTESHFQKTDCGAPLAVDPLNVELVPAYSLLPCIPISLVQAGTIILDTNTATKPSPIRPTICLVCKIAGAMVTQNLWQQPSNACFNVGPYHKKSPIQVKATMSSIQKLD